MSWLRKHLDSRETQGQPVVFAPSDDPALARFAELIEDDMTGLDADLGGHPLVLYYDPQFSTITVTATYRGQAAPETVSWTWQPGHPSADRDTGLVAPAPDSPLTEIARQATPLLVRAGFVHLSAERGDAGDGDPVVRGARRTSGDAYDYLELDR